MEIDIISLVETQVNPIALQTKSSFTDNLFQAESNFCIFNNNSNEIIGICQQGGVLTLIHSECVNIIRLSGSDITKLGRYN